MKLAFCFLVILFSCKLDTQSSEEETVKDFRFQTDVSQVINNNSIENRIKAPQNFKRTKVEIDSYGNYLRSLKLKPENSKVKFYNGAEKYNNNIYCAVIDLEIGNKDLHQCADAIIRLKAEYHWYKKEYDHIRFNFTNGFKAEYSKWKSGYRILVTGNKASWVKRADPSNTYEDFWRFLETIFMYAGTASLEKELVFVEDKNINIGDILIQGGHPGHAVIIVDKVENEQTGKFLYLLAQSYMPAQEIQILVNPNKLNSDPWFDLSGSSVKTPEWSFDITDLKRFVK